MITYSRLGARGNLGNHFFQIASVIGIAKRHGQDYFFPQWRYSDYFENTLPAGSMDESFIHLKEAEFNYHEWNIAANGNYDLEGWFQSEKYFDIPKTKEIYTFRKEFIAQTLEKHQSIFDKKTILVSVRRGDFVNNPNYFQLSYKYYLLALLENFPDLEQRKIVFTSDDISYCKTHYSIFRNAVFLENIPPMEQLVIGMHCDDYVISNSTFSWWMAWLGENENKRIYRPIKNLAGAFAKANDDKDFFPERWIAFDEKKYNLPLRYLPLILKGETYNLAVNTRHLYNSNWHSFKKAIKKLIGRN